MFWNQWPKIIESVRNFFISEAGFKRLFVLGSRLSEQFLNGLPFLNKSFLCAFPVFGIEFTYINNIGVFSPFYSISIAVINYYCFPLLDVFFASNNYVTEREIRDQRR